MRGAICIACLSLYVLAVLPAAAQQPADTTQQRVREARVEYADQLVRDRATVDQRLWLGDVRVWHDSTRLWADRVTEYLDRDEIFFVGNVVIIDEGDTLTADQVRYDTGRKIGEATGNVRLSDGEVEVFAPSGWYFVEEKRTAFEEGVTLVDSATVLTSQTGHYHTETKRADFAGQVQLSEEQTYLEADTVTYFRETETALARGRVFIERLGGEAADSAAVDSSLRTLLFGDWAFNDNQAGLSRVRGNPLLAQLQADSLGQVDTLLVRAERLYVFRRDSLQRLRAAGAVQVWQRDLAARGDSLVYDRLRRAAAPTDETLHLFGSPIAWFEQAQVTGDTLRVLAQDGRVDTLFVRQNAFVAQYDTLLQRIHQLKGQHLVGLFEDDSLRQLTVAPTAEAIYYLGDEAEPTQGGVQVSADSILFYLAQGGLDRARVLVNVEGTYYAEDLLPTPFQLAGFRWEPQRRPEKAALLGTVQLPARPRPAPLPVLTPEVPLPAEQ